MSDVEVIDRADIVRREVDRESTERALAVMDPVVLDTLFASREPQAIVQRIADVSTVLMDAVHQRDLARRYGNNDSEFLHIEAWQFLGSLLGMTAVGVDSRPLPDGSGWEATAELRHIASGRVLGRADGMCQRLEPGKRQAAENTLRQMAQVRARRAATRSVLGFVPRIGGFDISDPEGPVTKEQLAALHILEREIGFTHDEGHAEAGVESFTQLNREEAAAVLDRWTAIRNELVRDGGLSTAPEQSDEGLSRPNRPDSDTGVTGAPVVGDPPGEESAVSGLGKAGAVTRTPSGDLPANTTAWERATKAGLTSRKAMAIARGLGFEAKTSAELTGDQLTACLSQYLDKGKK